MATLESVLANTEAYLSNKMEGEALETLLAELKATVASLVKSPQLPIKSTLVALFIRFGIEESIAANLTKSLSVAIAKNRENEFEPGKIPIDEIEFPLLKENSEIINAKLQADDKEGNYTQFPLEPLLDVLSEACFTWARFVGSNVAEALSIADPYTVIKTKPHIDLLLAGRKIDPTSIANRFTRLSSEQILNLIKILSSSLTTVQERLRNRTQSLLESSNAQQWVYEKLRAHSFPHKMATTLSAEMVKKYSIDEMHDASGRQFRQMAVKLIQQLA